MNLSSTVPVVFTGHVDHGKSTLVARLILDTGGFPDGRLAELERASQRRGVPLELSFLLDAFQVERDQAVTIDATRVWFASAARRYAVIDAPGHREFVRHMISAASDARVAVVVVDAAQGLGEQTLRHALLLPLVGVRSAIVAVNKLDAVGFDEARYAAVESDVRALFARTGLAVLAVIPTVARDGDNVVARGARMPWYGGSTLLEALDDVSEAVSDAARPLRFPVQDVYRRESGRVLVGTVAAGRVATGDTVRVAPSGQTARIAAVVRFPFDRRTDASAGDAVGLRLDRPLFVDAGHVLSDPEYGPQVAHRFEATVFWLGAQALTAGSLVRVRCGTRDVGAVVEGVRDRVDLETAQSYAAQALERNDVGTVTLHCTQPIVVDLDPDAQLGRFALYRADALCGGGLTRAVRDAHAPERPRSANVFEREAGVSRARRAERFGHRGIVVWLTGLPSSGKTTLATLLETTLFAEGCNVFVLDGDSLRTGLSGDLGFSLADRSENVRRAGEAAALFADSGAIAVVSLVSPLAADRARARAAAGDRFHEVYVRAGLTTCEQRDVKGLYRRARSGEIPDFTGISSPYEEPDAPDLLLDTDRLDIPAAARVLADYVRAACATPAGVAGL